MNLRTYIQGLKIRQRQLAKAAKVTEASVSQWLNVENGIPASRARLIHDELGIPLELMRPDLWPLVSKVAKCEPFVETAA